MTEDELRRLIDEPGLRAEVSATALAETFLERIAERDAFNAVLTPTPRVARDDARRADAARARGMPLPLDGMPILIKDNIDVAGERCTVGSKLFYDRVAENDAFVIERLRNAGAVILGKSFLHEFAFGATSNTILGTCRNPWDPARIPGGSSGGSGAALAADFAVGALGTDTGGSVRLPAAFNGVTGLRPTHGAVSNRGVHPLSPSFDTVGPMARSAGDVGALFGAMAGYDPGDTWSRRIPAEAFAQHDGVRGLRIGLIEGFFFEGADPQIAALVRAAAASLAELGARVSTLHLPDAEEAYDAATVMARAEACATYAQYLNDPRAVMGEDVRARFELGRSLSGADYADALETAMRWRRRLGHIFAEEADLLLTPTVPIPTPLVDGIDTLEATTVLTRSTYPWSLAGIPAVSFPCGFRDDGMPAGVQVAAAPFREDLVLAAAAAYQTVTDWHRRRPVIPVAKAGRGSGVNT